MTKTLEELAKAVDRAEAELDKAWEELHDAVGRRGKAISTRRMASSIGNSPAKANNARRGRTRRARRPAIAADVVLGAVPRGKRAAITAGAISEASGHGPTAGSSGVSATLKELLDQGAVKKAGAKRATVYWQ
jgi:hypothetical protein